MAREAKDLWEVCVANQRPDGNGGTETYYSYLSHKGRSVWGERTAKKHAREFKANHLKDAWATPC